MFINHFLIALRHIRRNKLYSVINIFCLAAGIAVAMIILIYILHEHSYDKWHAGSDRIFSLTTPSKFGSESFVNDRVTLITGPSVLSSPAVEGMVRMMPGYPGIELRNAAMPQARFRENDHFLFADSNFFSFFSFRLRRGRPNDVLARPFTVVLTETAAKKYFGAVDPVGKILQLDSKYQLEVTGVAEDVPVNSSIRFEMVAALNTMAGMENYKPYVEGGNQLQTGSFYTYVKLKNPSDSAEVGRMLTHLSLAAAGKAPKPEGFQSLMKESHQFALFPMGAIHLKGPAGKINSRYQMPFLLAAGIVLLLALVNYMSLATARAAARAREVGVRKVLGAGRGKIAGQFYVESALFALASFFFGAVLFLWLRPYFFDLMGLKMVSRFLYSPVVLGFFGVLLVVIILIAGSYPSLVLSGYRPVVVLYGKMSRERSGEQIRKGFIVLQFSLSMALVICSAIVGKELYYIRHVDTGINRENIVMFNFDGTMEHYGAYKQEVAALPQIQETGTSYFKLYSGGTYINSLQVPGQIAPINISGLFVDSSFIHLLGLKWVQAPPAGSNWMGAAHLILNQAAVEAGKLTGDVIGRRVELDKMPMTVTGVLKNFNFIALRNPIEPFGLQVADKPDIAWGPGMGGCLYVKIRAHTNTPTVIEAIKNIYKKYDDRTPFEFEFLDESFDSNYKAEDRLAGIFGVFTVITIGIACLGLFALATFSAQQRVREIGIRKVLGASVASIGVLLSRDFLRPVLLAIVIACPVSWWVMHRWLEDFAYRTSLSWWVFAGAGLGLLAVALATVLVRSLKAGRANPVDNLRSE